MKHGIITIVLAASFSSIAFAQVEIFGFGGIESGKEYDLRYRCVTYPCPIYGRVEMGKRFGAAVDFRLSKRLDVEVVVHHQISDAYALNPASASREEVRFPEGSLDKTTVQSGLMASHRFADWQIFGVFGAGVSHLDWDIPWDEVGKDTVFSTSFGGGARYSFSPRIGLRLEVRGSWTDMPESFSGLPDPTWGSKIRYELNAGITVGLGK